MKKFNYCPNHKADEAYMANMCHKGFAAKSLVEGVWTFEPCEPDEYTFRVCYLRGKSDAEIEKLKSDLAAKQIEFVSRYSFWAIFRSKRDFRLYTEEQELEICRAIRRPMIFGSFLCPIYFGLLVLSAAKLCKWLFIPAAVFAAYGAMCIFLCTSYTRLIKKLTDKRKEG